MTTSQKKGLFLPKIVDKIQKRKDIAHVSIELFTNKGFHNITVNQIALNANVAKGTIYEYFKSKEEILFAIIEYAQDDYDNEVIDNINNTDDIKEKIIFLFDLCISTTPQGQIRRQIYKEFISICLNDPSEKMVEFFNDIKIKYLNWLKEILQEAINNKQLKPEVLELADGLFAMAEGVLVFSNFENYYTHNIIESYIDSLFKLIYIGEENE